MDFWNDGEYVRGCIAGGRYYFHINANGDVEPCAFIHYSTVNIKQVSLLEALRSPLFKAYQQRQPFNKNHLRPCPLLDNPHSLKEVVRVSEHTYLLVHEFPLFGSHHQFGYSIVTDRLSVSKDMEKKRICGVEKVLSRQ